ncbi:glycosyltransferase 87 family protein [Streptomyces sp. TLI_171]|uniref:glycosyltransferase 87 family protein n=1 Tax=Streptomyces sp. TLI_171 TaxID=1938859 RepID=UPI0015D53979|nr:glycosyltransferase 87 family protein [Streptomyces sp. TLI_171]
MPTSSADTDAGAASPSPEAAAQAAATVSARSSLWRVESWNIRVAAPLGVWACTRLLMIMMVFSTHENANGEVHHLYEKWARILEHGSFPVSDVTWQYPPGAAGVILAPTLVPGVNYVQGFILVTLVADALVLAALVRTGARPGRRMGGAWVWTLMLPLMQFIPYARYDVIVTMFAVLGLLCLQRGGWLGGGLAAVGAMIKVWPAFAVFGAPRGKDAKSIVLGFLASALALTAVMSFFFTGGFAFLKGQGHRGVEFESLGGSALLAARLFGYPGEVTYRYGSFEYVGPHVGVVGKALVALTVLGFAWLMLWRLKARAFSPSTPADAALAATLVFVATSRVISPQYLIWLAGLGAVCLTYRQTTQRPVVGILLVATALTTVEYPFFWEKVVAGHAGFTVVLILRNAVLVVATVLSCVRLWRSTVPSRRSGDC